MPRNRISIRLFRNVLAGLNLGLCIHAGAFSAVLAAQTVKSDCKGPRATEQLRQIALSLDPADMFVHELQGGRVGDGIHRPWMDLMAKEGIRSASLTIEFLWSADTRVLVEAKATTIDYFREYSRGKSQVTGRDELKRLRVQGLEHQLQMAALDVARKDIPAFGKGTGGKIRGQLSVVLWDYECLPSLSIAIPSNIVGADETELMKAVMNGDLDRVRTLVASGSNLEAMNGDGQTALMYAIPEPEVAEYLVLSGANVNHSDKNGESVLMNAARIGDPSLVSELIKRGADVNAREDTGQTPLLFSVSPYSSPKTVELLIAAGADVNAKDNHGRTALMAAAASDRREIVELLLAAHADVDLKDDKGQTALSIASRLGRDKIMALLRNANR